MRTSACTCSLPVSSPKRSRRAKAPRISTGADHHTSILYRALNASTAGVAFCFAQSGTRALESQNAYSIGLTIALGFNGRLHGHVMRNVASAQLPEGIPVHGLLFQRHLAGGHQVGLLFI